MKKYFIHELHIRQTHRIALFLPNCSDFICAFLAAADIGAVTVPLNTHLREKELQYYIDKCGIKTVVTHSDLLPQWGAMPLRMKTVNFVTADLSLHAGKIRSAQDAHHISVTHSPGDDVLYLCTSGSTGRPKIIPKTHAGLVAGADNLGNALAIKCQDRFLVVAPLFHANGFENCMLLPILRGASLVLMRHFSPRKLLELLHKERITVLNGSPFIFSSLIDIADKKYDLSSIRHCLSTGAPLPDSVKHIFFERFNLTVREHYGSSETGPISVQPQTCNHDGSIGRPFDNVKVKIVDDEGTELPAGNKGEVLIHSNSMMKGYLDEPELTKEALTEDNFVRTGDIGKLDSSGSLHIIGRKKMIINASGIKIDPVEIQNVLLSFRKVKAAFVVGVKNKRGMEMVKAIVVAKPPCTVNEIILFCKERLADYKIPRIIEFRDEIPTDVMGKIIRPQMEE